MMGGSKKHNLAEFVGTDITVTTEIVEGVDGVCQPLSSVQIGATWERRRLHRRAG